jgi:hypothetical protein
VISSSSPRRVAQLVGDLLLQPDRHRKISPRRLGGLLGAQDLQLLPAHLDLSLQHGGLIHRRDAKARLRQLQVAAPSLQQHPRQPGQLLLFQRLEELGLHRRLQLDERGDRGQVRGAGLGVGGADVEDVAATVEDPPVEVQPLAGGLRDVGDRVFQFLHHAGRVEERLGWRRE